MFKTHKSVRRTTTAEINTRNRINREYEAATAKNERLESLTESSWSKRMESIDKHRKTKLPIIQRRVALEYTKLMPEILFREYFTNLVTESLIWDKEAVAEYADGIRLICHKYIKHIGGLEALKEAAELNDSNYLRKVYKTCMETGKKVGESKGKREAKKIDTTNVDEPRHLDFSLTEKEDEEVTTAMKNLNLDELSDMVKNKVLTVVKDENESQKKEDDFVADIKDEIDVDEEINEKTPREINNGDVADEEGATDEAGADEGGAETGESGAASATVSTSATTAESLKNFAVGGIRIQRSLFRSIANRVMADTIRGVKENAASGVAATNDDDMDGDIAKDLYNTSNNVNVYDIFMHDPNDDLQYIDFARNSSTKPIAGDNKELGTDEVLAESIGFYTILECANTIKLITPSKRDIVNVISHNSKVLK